MKLDASTPSRAKSFTPEDFLAWVGELQERCSTLHCCYEAGPFGCCLHRKLVAMGVVNDVIRPINWDNHGKRVKTDARDAAQMVLCLDGSLRSNDRGFNFVCVPERRNAYAA